MGWLTAAFGQSRSPRADLALAFGIGGLAALLLWQAGKIPPPFFDPLGSAAIPNAIAIALAVLAAIVLVRALLARPWPPRAATEGYRSRPDIAVGICIAAVAYVAAMDFDILGFSTATMLFVVIASALLGRFRLRVTLIGVLVALVVGLGGEYLFTQIFFIALP